MSTTAAAAGDRAGLKFASGPGRWVLLATVLGSAIASIDATVVGIALPAIGRNFRVGFAALQWVVTAYTLTLAGLLLFAGALGDKYGRKRIFQTGVTPRQDRRTSCSPCGVLRFLVGLVELGHHSCMVASMVSRRAARAFADFAIQLSL